MLTPWPLETRVPSAAYFSFDNSKNVFSRGSPTKFPSVFARVWHPPIIIPHILSLWKIVSGAIILYFSAVDEPTAVIPLIIKSV